MITIPCIIVTRDLKLGVHTEQVAAVTWYDSGRAALINGRHAPLLGYQRRGEVFPNAQAQGDPVFAGPDAWIEIQVPRAKWNWLADSSWHQGPLPSVDRRQGQPHPAIYTRVAAGGPCIMCGGGSLDSLLNGRGLPEFVICWDCGSIVQSNTGTVPQINLRASEPEAGGQ